MANSKKRYFKKDKTKFKVGYSDTIFEYDFRRHKIDDLVNRFIECDKNGKAIAKKVKKVSKKKAGK